MEQGSSVARSWPPRPSHHDLLQVEYAQLVPYAKGVSARTRVLDLHNVESELVKSMAALRAPPARLALGAEAMRLRRLEGVGLRSFDATVVVSERDRARLPTDAPVLVCPNGWHDDGTASCRKGERRRICRPARLGPERGRCGLAREGSVAGGSRSGPRREALAHRTGSLRARSSPCRAVTSRSPARSPEVAPYLARARVATAPLRAGGGSRLKILEALDAARPVVATTIGAEGLEDLVGSGIVLADSPDVMATKIVAFSTTAAGRSGSAGPVTPRSANAIHGRLP